jgi:hypothetical protein
VTPEPIEYQSVRNLQAALLAMTVVGGYHYDMNRVAVKLDPNQNIQDFILPDGPRPMMVVELGEETWDYEGARRLKLLQKLILHWINTSDATIDEDKLHVFFNGCADVERAITQDITRGGLVTDTKIRSRVLDQPPHDGSQVWAKVGIELLSHRTYGAPDA